MSVIDINALLTEVSPDQPCGDNLEYDPVFIELERAARGKEEQTLLGDATRAREKLGWQPRVDFPELVADMIRGDLELARRDRVLEDKGIRPFSYRE